MCEACDLTQRFFAAGEGLPGEVGVVAALTFVRNILAGAERMTVAERLAFFDAMVPDPGAQIITLSAGAVDGRPN